MNGNDKHIITLLATDRHKVSQSVVHKGKSFILIVQVLKCGSAHDVEGRGMFLVYSFLRPNFPILNLGVYP